MRNLILFEVNEVPTFILDHYSRRHPDSRLTKVLSQSAQYETYVYNEGHLSPWITWPTLHRGVSNTLHKINDFGEDLTEVDVVYPPIWKILQSHGIRTGVFLSMHSYPPPADYMEYAFYVPDPFAGESKTNPPVLEPFQRFNLAMSRRSMRNVDAGIDVASAKGLVGTLPKIGIRGATLARTAAHVVRERIRPVLKTRRRTFQSILAFDVFMDLMRKKRPQFATFFTNHVASAMHRYWAAAFPEHYQDYRMPQQWKKDYQGEVDFAMGVFDEFVGRITEFARAYDYVILFASSMGQAATRAEIVSTELYSKNFSRFLEKLGLERFELRHAMHPQYNFVANDEETASLFRQRIGEFLINGLPLNYREKEHGFFAVDLGHQNLKIQSVTFMGQPVSLEEFGLSNEPIEDETGSTAYHIPEGSLFIYDPRDLSPKAPRQKGLDTRAFAPSILQNFGIAPTAYMSQSRIPEIAKA